MSSGNVRRPTIKPEYKAPLSPTEKHRRDVLMKQFCKLESSVGSKEFRANYDKIDWKAA